MDIATGTGSMEREDTVDDRVYRLSARQSIVDETHISSRCCRMKAKAWNCIMVQAGTCLDALTTYTQ